jgi:hypothetical protein
MFVAFFDEFVHFEHLVIFGDSLNLHTPYEGCRHTSFRDRTPIQNFWLTLTFVLTLNFTASGVFLTSSFQKPFIPVHVLCMSNTFHHPSQSLYDHENVCQEDIARNEEFLELGWRVFRNFDSFLWMTSFFFQNLKYCYKRF